MPREFGGYVLLEEVARGGMGIVYKARQQQVQRTVALKVMVSGQFSSPDSVERFLTEADAAASLDHPNIVPVYEVGEFEGQPFFSMKLIDGRSLAHRLAGLESPMPQREAAELLAKLARAVHYAHQRGILHRDIKPGNVMLDAQGEPHLMDFGLAKLVENDSTLTRTMAMLGTPSYMSPEQARGQTKELTTAVDVYGLGAILYELLAGQPPFAGGTTMETVRQVLEKELRRPSVFNPAVDRDLDTICLKCLEKDPGRRYGSAEALASDLDRWRRHEPILARPSPPLERTVKWIRRNPGVFAALSVIALSLTAGATVSTWLALKEAKAWKEEFKQRMAAQDAQAVAMGMQRKAEIATRQADANLRRAEWLVYAGKLMLAQTEFEFGNGGLAGRYLSESQEDLRGWEYRYLSKRINAQQTLLGHNGTVSSVAFSPDGQRIITGSEDGTAKVWETATGREVLTLKGRKGQVLSVAYSPDGRRIVTGSGDWGFGQIPGEATVWDAESGQPLFELKEHNYYVWSVAFSADGQRIVTAAGDRDHKGGEAKVWDAMTGREVLALQGCTESLRGAVFSPDGRRIIAATIDGTSKMWDAVTGQPVFPLKGHSEPITSVAFSPDGRQFATGSLDCTVIVWDSATTQPLFTRRGHKEAVTCVAFSLDGQQFVSGSRDQTTKLWNSMMDEEVLSLKGHAGIVRGVAFSPDGKRIVTGSEDRTAKVWDARLGQDVLTLKGHTDFVNSIAFSPNSQRFVTGSGDGGAKVWDI
ncbi:MAG: protein kinase domain-containing protein, partial [Verrucomicrobiales bacterium]